MKIEVEETWDGMKQMLDGFKFIEGSAVYVGIPQKNSSREDNSEGITNAELLFIHTNGSPINNVPARPVVEPAIEDDQERLTRMLTQSYLLAFSGRIQDALLQLQKTGMRAQNIARNWFVNPKNGWPPNSPGVQAAKRKKGSTNPRPLIDTGELRKSITYVVDSIFRGGSFD